MADFGEYGLQLPRAYFATDTSEEPRRKRRIFLDERNGGNGAGGVGFPLWNRTGRIWIQTGQDTRKDGDAHGSASYGFITEMAIV